MRAQRRHAEWIGSFREKHATRRGLPLALEASHQRAHDSEGTWGDELGALMSGLAYLRDRHGANIYAGYDYLNAPGRHSTRQPTIQQAWHEWNVATRSPSERRRRMQNTKYHKRVRQRRAQESSDAEESQ